MSSQSRSGIKRKYLKMEDDMDRLISTANKNTGSICVRDTISGVEYHTDDIIHLLPVVINEIMNRLEVLETSKSVSPVSGEMTMGMPKPFLVMHKLSQILTLVHDSRPDYSDVSYLICPNEDIWADSSNYIRITDMTVEAREFMKKGR